MLAERIQSPLRISEGKNPNETVIVKFFLKELCISNSWSVQKHEELVPQNIVYDRYANKMI